MKSPGPTHQPGSNRGDPRTSVLPLAKIGNASTVKLCLCLGANPRRFRFGGKLRGHIYGVAGAQKLAPRSASFTEVSGEEEAGGVCRGRGYSMDFQSQPTDNSSVRALCCKADIAISPGPYILSMAQMQRLRRLRLRSYRLHGSKGMKRRLADNTLETRGFDPLRVSMWDLGWYHQAAAAML